MFVWSLLVTISHRIRFVVYRNRETRKHRMKQDKCFYIVQDCCQGKVKLVGRSALFLFVHKHNVHRCFMHTDNLDGDEEHKRKFNSQKPQCCCVLFMYVEETNPEKFMQKF